MHPNRDTGGAKRIPCKLHATKLQTAAEQQLRNAFSLCSTTGLRSSRIALIFGACAEIC
jgi:hypothetical protein